MDKKHYFNAPDDDKGSRFCKCGKYLTDEIHHRFPKPSKVFEEMDREYNGGFFTNKIRGNG